MFQDFKEEYESIEAAIKESQMVYKFILVFYNSCVTFMEIAVTFILPGRNFLTPVWAPFIDWKNDFLSYALLNLFEYIGMTYEVNLTVVVDTEPAANIILLTGHVIALRKRVAKIGWDKAKSADENHIEFIECIKYHMMVLE